MSTNTDKQWRLQVKAKNGNWVNRGLFETRAHAREVARELRGYDWYTRVILYVKAKKA